MNPRISRTFTLLLMLGAVLGAAASTAVLFQRQARLRGALDGWPELEHPYRVPILGVNADLTQYDDQALTENLDLISETGFAWVRQIFSWSAIEARQNEYNWTDYDAIVEQASARNLELVAVLWQSPEWAADHVTAAPSNLADFAAFAAALAERYGDDIDVYQIWDEPNLSSGWGGLSPDPIAYAALLEAAYSAIHAHDPDALVLTAGLAPTIETGPDNLSDVLYLRALYENGTAPFFDGVAGKPYGFDTGPSDRRVDPNLLNLSRFLLLREEMVRNGDQDKPLWASHFGWNSLPKGWEGNPSVWGLTTPETQTEWTLAAYERALQEWPWAGALILDHWQPDAPVDNPRWGFALRSQEDELSPLGRAIRANSDQYNESLWPGIYPASIPLASYSGEWKFSELGADIVEDGSSTVEVPIAGERMGVIARRDNYRAYLYTTIDGQPSHILPQDERGSYAVLTSPDYKPRIEIIPLAENLPPEGSHIVRIEAERGWDQWAVAGFAVGNDIDTLPYDTLLTSLVIMTVVFAGLAVRMGHAADWPLSLRAGAAKLNAALSNTLHLVLALSAALAVWIGATLTWGGLVPSLVRRLGDGPSLLITALTAGVFYFSPWLLLTLVALIVLFILIYTRPSTGLALMMFFTPFYLLPRALFDRAFSMVEVTSLLTFATWAIHITAARRDEGWPSLAGLYRAMTGLDKAVALFVGIGAISLLWADFKGVAFTELRQMIVEPLVMYLVLRTMPLNREERWRIIDLLILSGTLVSLYGFYQLATGADLIRAEQGAIRLRSVFGTPNNLALYLGRLIPISAAIVLISRHPHRRWLYGLAGVVMLGAAVMTFSKGALLLGIPTSVALVVILWAGKAGLIAVAGGLVVLLLALIPLSRHPRFQSLFDLQAGSSFFRVQLWQSALRMIADHPITGLGLDQFLYAYRGKYILPSAWQQPDLSQPHNFVLNYWVRLGVVGLVAGIWMQVAFWRMAWRVQQRLKDIDRDQRALAVGLMGGMANFIAHGLVDEVHFVIDLAFIFFMTLGIMHQLNIEMETGADGSDH